MSFRIGNTKAITWDSKPDYDGWGWDSYWSCLDWQKWFIALKNHYGQKQAKQIWLTAADKVDGFEHFNWCRYNSSFVAFLKENDLMEITNVISRSANAGTSIVDGAGSLLDFLGKNIKPLLIGGLLLYGFKMYSDIEANKRRSKA